MTRLPYLRRDALGPEAEKVWDGVVETRGSAVVTDAGGLAGPFNAWLHAPGVGSRLMDLGAVLRFQTSLDRGLLELAIITVGAHWKAEFEWWAHARMAREHGIGADVIDAIGRGDTPPGLSPDESVVHHVARQLVETGRVDPDALEQARTALGDQGVVELVSLCGYYTLVSFTLNAFDVPLPPGVAARWGSGPA